MSDAETDASDDTCSFCTAPVVASGTAQNPASGRTTAEVRVCATHLAALASAGTDACALGTGPADHTLPSSVLGAVEIDGETEYTGRWALCDDHFDEVAVPRGD